MPLPLTFGALLYFLHLLAHCIASLPSQLIAVRPLPLSASSVSILHLPHLSVDCFTSLSSQRIASPLSLSLLTLSACIWFQDRRKEQ